MNDDVFGEFEPPVSWLTLMTAAERRAWVRRTRDECGASFNKIAQALGVTTARARQIYYEQQ